MVTTLEAPAGATPADEFEALRAQGQAAVDLGRWGAAIEAYQQALKLAERAADQSRLDLAFCNLVSVYLSHGESEAFDPQTFNRLREILLRGEDLRNCFLAAYNLARAFEHKRNWSCRKGLFYARIALDRATLLGHGGSIAASRNQIANFLVAQSLFDQAAAEYAAALETGTDFSELKKALILGNLGYCNLMRGMLPGTLASLYRSLRTLRRLEAAEECAIAHLDLCFAHLELRRYRDSIRHALYALRLAEEHGPSEVVKNALYLLGEAYQLAGHPDLARGFYTRLRDGYFPGLEFIPDFLLTVDVRKMINLRAAA